MKLKKILQSNRCGKCKQNHGHRFCLRRAQSICWQCCNDLRIDRKCPDDCKYVISEKSENFALKTNADSQKEFSDLLKKEMDYWIRNPQPMFEHKIPMLMAESEAGKKELEKVFENLTLPAYIPIQHLFERLKLKNIKFDVTELENPEKQAEAFLDCLLEHDFEATIPMLYQQNSYQQKEFRNAYLKRLSSHKLIKKLYDYSLISCSTNEDKNQALIHFEINRKYDFTLHLKKRDKWLIAAKLFGDVKHAIAENEAVKQVAVLLSKKDYNRFLPLIEKYSSIYVDSADMHYYWSVYYTINEQKSIAKEFLRTAIELDENFIDAKYNYAFLMHIDNQLLEAEKWYRNILEYEPNDVKTLNNLASILVDRGEEEIAKELLEKCLTIKPDFEIAKKNYERIGGTK